MKTLYEILVDTARFNYKTNSKTTVRQINY